MNRSRIPETQTSRRDAHKLKLCIQATDARFTPPPSPMVSPSLSHLSPLLLLLLPRPHRQTCKTLTDEEGNNDHSVPTTNHLRFFPPWYHIFTSTFSVVRGIMSERVSSKSPPVPRHTGKGNTIRKRNQASTRKKPKKNSKWKRKQLASSIDGRP